MMTLGIAIPLGHEDIPYIHRLLDSIDNSTLLPDVVSISVSGIPKFEYLKEHKFKIIITHSMEPYGASKNRNIASKILDTDVISFIDADDVCHPQRNEYIMEAMKTSTVVVHDYLQTTDINNELLDTTYEFPKIFQNYIDTIVDNCKFPISSREFKPYACGHASVKKEILKIYQYNESLVYGEDAEFLQFIVRDNIFITLIENKLTNYIK
jgi:glycosyltransferase involved in cell wall biosynthesis